MNRIAAWFVEVSCRRLLRGLGGGCRSAPRYW